MTDISTAAAASREAARDPQGRFGTWSAPESDTDQVDLDPRREDWYDPDTGGAPSQAEHAERVHAAMDALEDVASEGYEANFQDETSRLNRGRQALARVFRTSHPQVARIHLAEESDGVYVDHAVGHDGTRVDIASGWPDDTDPDDVDRHVRDLVGSPVPGAVEEIFPTTRGDMVVDVDAELETDRPPF